ncbi:MAG TPA: VWA domain-containing protein [Acidimicrobiales bacterium]|nr:VWA domain-containing protein [Acidimicrobiales bacterium]
MATDDRAHDGPDGSTAVAADPGADAAADRRDDASLDGAVDAGAIDAGAQLAVGFVRALRRAGVAVPVGATLAWTAALGEVGLARRDHVYWAGRATLLGRPEDLDVYDRVFAAYWQRGAPLEARAAAPPEQVTIALDDGGDEPPPGGEMERADQPTISVRYSAQEILRDRDFAECSDAELAEAYRLMAGLKVHASPRPSRRHRRSARSNGRPDLRRTVRAALRAGGEPVRRHHTTPATRPRRLVLLVDVSGSMEPYSRALVRFVHAAVVGRGRVEVFALGTRLTRLTRELSTRDPDAALARAALAVTDWSGGTRLGDGLRRFNDEWGVRGTARQAIVVILSDGWDRGDPDVLGEQMARLHRVAHRVVWVNPLKASPGYQPLARGMAAALPHVDRFVEGHSLASLEQLAEELAA